MTSLEDRFNAKFIAVGPVGCWLWTGAVDNYNYGQIKVNGSTERAHRVAWGLSYGPIPDGLCVCHHCDNPSCVRPDHLFLGTHADNMADRDAKGRARGGPRPGAAARGEANGRAKLTATDVANMRLLKGKWTGRRIAAHFGVSDSQVSSILNGRSWKLEGKR